VHTTKRCKFKRKKIFCVVLNAMGLISVATNKQKIYYYHLCVFNYIFTIFYDYYLFLFNISEFIQVSIRFCPNKIGHNWICRVKSRNITFLSRIVGILRFVRAFLRFARFWLLPVIHSKEIIFFPEYHIFNWSSKTTLWGDGETGVYLKIVLCRSAEGAILKWYHPNI